MATEGDKIVAGGCLVFWGLGVLLSLGVLGLLCWAVIRLVLKYT